MFQEKKVDKVIVLPTKNNKGQALVEFVLILPILLLFLFVIIDFANIYYNKNHLEGVVSDIVAFVENGKTTDEIYNSLDDEYFLDIKTSDGYATVKLSKEVDLITPMASFIFGEPYKIDTQRTIIYE